MSNIRETVTDICLRVIELEPSEIGLDDPFANFSNIDSLKALDVLMALEHRYNLIFPDSVVKEFETINKVIAVVERYVPENG